MRLSKEYLQKTKTTKLKKQKKDALQKLSSYSDLIIGTLQRRHHFCRKQGCKCMDKKSPQPHGPYNYLFYRSGIKPGMVVLNSIQYKKSLKMIKNYHMSWELLCLISSLNVELLRRKNI